MNIETHLHFGGSIDCQCVYDIIQEQGLNYLAESYDDCVKAMTFAPNEEPGYHKFLNKFKILDEIRWDRNTIEKSVISICKRLEKENIQYALIDFSINKYMSIGWHKTEAIEFIYYMFQKHRPNKIGLILSVKYESVKHTQEQYLNIIENKEIAKLLVGVDLVGDETCYDYKFYKDLLKPWLKADKLVRAHVGEFGSVDNVRTAITELNVTNIAHGISIVKDKSLFKLAKKVIFDTAITSNYLTGVVESDSHPVSTMANDLIVTISTDDPVICNTTLYKEFKNSNLDIDIIDQIKKNAYNLIKRRCDVYNGDI